MTDDQFVKAMASPIHYRELRTYLIMAKEQGARFNDDIPTWAWDCIPESLESKYPDQQKKASNNPAAYRELKKFLWGKFTTVGDGFVCHAVFLFNEPS